jgi:hypothetical protein
MSNSPRLFCFPACHVYAVPQDVRLPFPCLIYALPCFSLLCDFILSNGSQTMYDVTYELYRYFPVAFVSYKRRETWLLILSFLSFPYGFSDCTDNFIDTDLISEPLRSKPFNLCMAPHPARDDIKCSPKHLYLSAVSHHDHHTAQRTTMTGFCDLIMHYKSHRRRL